MAERSFKLKLISANGLNKLNRVGKMDVYAVAYISGGTVTQDQKQRTYVDKGGDSNPTWNCSMKFTIDEYAVLKNRSTLTVKIIMEATLGDKTVGEVHVPIKELLDGYLTGNKPLRFVSYQVKKPSGKLKGELNFSYKFGASELEKPAGKLYKADELVTPCNHAREYNKLDEPVTGYRSTSLYPQVYDVPVDAAPEFCPPPPAAATPSSFPPVGGAYYTPVGYPQPQAGYMYNQQPGYGGYPASSTGYDGYPPKQTGYGGYSQPLPVYEGYHSQQSGFGGYPPPPTGYDGYYSGYSQPPPVYNGYPPQQPGYGGYPPSPTWYDGYPPQQSGNYGYPSAPPRGYRGYSPKTSYGYPRVQKKKNVLGLGFGVWLLAVVGGLVLGEIMMNVAACGGCDGGC